MKKKYHTKHIHEDILTGVKDHSGHQAIYNSKILFSRTPSTRFQNTDNQMPSTIISLLQ